MRPPEGDTSGLHEYDSVRELWWWFRDVKEDAAAHLSA